MLGMGDFAIFLVFVLCIASALACVVYGIINWNKGDDTQEKVDDDWNEEEETISEKLEI